MTTIDTANTANFSLNTPAVPLDQLPMGTRCRVEAVDENSESLLRLMEMGLTPGVVVVIEREAPLKSPYSLRLAGCTLAVRRDDARRVLVIPMPDSIAEGK